jgi:hypothetical protein
MLKYYAKLTPYSRTQSPRLNTFADKKRRKP